MASAVSAHLSEKATDLMIARVDGNLVSNDCSIVGTAISDACPASEWYVIANRLSGERRAVLPSYADRLGAAPSPISSTLQGKTSQRELLCAEQTFPDEQFAAEMCTTQQAVVCDALVSTSALWARSLTNVTAKTGHGSPLSDQSDSSHTIAENYSQPYSDALCLPDRVQNFSDSRPVALPLLPMANSPDLATGNLTYKPGYTARTIRHPGLLYHHLLNTPGDAQEYRIRWIELPGNLFNGSSIGAAILLPPPQATTEPNVLLCNIAAGWGSAYLALENSNFGYSSANSKIRYGADFDIARVPMDIGYAPRAESEAGVDSLVFKYPYYPQRPVNISQSWARYLNPMIEGSNTTVVNSLMQQQIFPENPSTTARGMLASLIVNGLARTGWEGFLQGEVRTAGANGQGGLDGNYWLSGKGDVFKVDPEVSQEWVTLRVDSTLQGYAYNTLTTPPRIAIAIMTAYCLLVVGHTLYSGITGELPLFLAR